MKRELRASPDADDQPYYDLGMLPMAMAIGSSGSTTQGLAVVDIGGLTVGLFVALFMLPVYYALMNRKPKAYNGWDID